MYDEEYLKLMDEYHQARRMQHLVNFSVLSYGDNAPKGAQESLKKAEADVNRALDRVYDYFADFFSEAQ